MALLFIIAGPPGIGKSSSGKFFHPLNIDFLNHDALSLFITKQKENTTTKIYLI